MSSENTGQESATIRCEACNIRHTAYGETTEQAIKAAQQLVKECCAKDAKLLTSMLRSPSRH